MTTTEIETALTAARLAAWRISERANGAPDWADSTIHDANGTPRTFGILRAAATSKVARLEAALGIAKTLPASAAAERIPAYGVRTTIAGVEHYLTADDSWSPTWSDGRRVLPEVAWEIAAALGADVVRYYDCGVWEIDDIDDVSARGPSGRLP